MKKLVKIFLLVIFCSFCTSINLIKAETKKVVVNDIIIKNNQRIDSETILSYLGIDKGDTVNYEILNSKLKEMYKLGLFADIKFRIIQRKLIVLIKENPVVNNVTFSGNKAIKDGQITPEIQLKSRNVFRKRDLQDSIISIRELYKQTGYFSAILKPTVSKLSQNRVDINIKIIEGTKTRIKQVKFIGNKVFSDKRLKGILSTKESKFYRILSAGDVYDPDRINYDKDVLRRYYLKEGYADFQVKSTVAEMTRDKKNFFITFSVDEGEKYKFGDVKVQTKNEALNKQTLDEIISPLKNSTYNIQKLDDVLQGLKEHVDNAGFAFLKIKPDLNKNVKDKKINITFIIGESKKVYVGRIDISGNSRTEDEVIRREFRFNEGDSFSNEKLMRSRQRIQNLGFFENVEIEKTDIGLKDRINLDVKVNEKQTGQFNVGGGFSSTNGAMANVGLAEKNFRGKGQNIKVSMTIAERQDQFDISFTEPYLRNKNVAAGFDLFKIKTTYADESSYDTDSLGTAIRVGYMIAERTRHSWNYTLIQEDVEGIKSTASDFIANQKGEYTTSAIGHTLTYFGFNDNLNPTSGTQWRIENKLAGIGGNVSFFKSDIKLSKYFSITDDYIWGSKLKAGYIFGYNDDDINLKDRYFLGGDSFPGFEQAGVGPRDTTSTNEDSLGGNLMYTLEFDLRTPIPGIAPQLGINGRFYTIAGAVTEIDENGSGKIKDNSNPRVSVGFGIQWKSPFGPVSIDFTQAVIKEDFDRTQFIKFSFGTRF